MIKTTKEIAVVNVHEMNVKQLERGGSDKWDIYSMKDIRFMYQGVEYRLFDRIDDIIIVSLNQKGGEVVYYEKEGNRLQFSNISDAFRDVIKEALDYDLMPSLF